MEVDKSPDSPCDIQVPLSPQAEATSLPNTQTDNNLYDGIKSLAKDGNYACDAENTTNNECLNMKSPSDVPPFQDDEISNDFLREEEEQQMDCDDKNHEVQEDFDMKSPTSETDHENNKTDFTTEANVSVSQVSEFDTCNHSTDIEDKMDELSDMRDSDFDTSQITDNEDVNSIYFNNNSYTDERETTLVEQNQTASSSELDASLNKHILHSSDIEHFDTSTQSPKMERGEVSNINSSEDENEFSEENVDGGKEEILPTPTEDICADVSQNVEESNENKELANYEASPCNNSDESAKLTSENVLQDNRITSVQTEEINSPENSDTCIEDVPQRDTTGQSPLSSTGKMFDEVSEEGESQDSQKNQEEKSDNMLGPTSPVSEESDFEEGEVSHSLKKSEIVEAASPVSDETNSDQEQGEIIESKNNDAMIGPASPVSDESDHEQGEIIDYRDKNSLMGPTSPVSDESDQEQGQITESKNDNLLGPASPVSDASDIEEGERDNISKYDLSRGKQGLSPTSLVSEDGSFPDDDQKGPRTPSSPYNEQKFQKAQNGNSSAFVDHAAQRLEKEYKDISDEEDSFSDDEKPLKQKTVQEKSTIKSKQNDRVKSHMSIADDHGELDYIDEEEEDVGKEEKEKLEEDSKEGEDKIELEDGEHDSDKDDGEVEDDDDCEEGEIKEPGNRKPFIKPTCRFYIRGLCTWGSNCRFLHPGVNDKGNYRLFEGPNDKPIPPPWEEMEEEELPPPPPPPPKPTPAETAWERGLRHAKELRKKANKRKEQEPDFEDKKMNLSVDEEREFNKENDRQNPFFEEQVYDDEYYDKVPVHRTPVESPAMWHPAQYENFEVRWNREPEWMPPPYIPREREHFDYHSRHYSPPPPPPPQVHRFDKRREIHRRKDFSDDRVNNHSHQTFNRPRAADQWHDPWQRSKSPKHKSRTSRSHSRGRRKSRRSHSYSSSFSSSSFSGSSHSGSRSSSYSRSYSRSSSGSRSSSASSKNSRSPSKSPSKRHPIPKRPPKSTGPDAPKSAVQKSKNQKSPVKRRPVGQGSPKKQPQGPPLQPIPPGGRGRPRDKNIPKPPGKAKGRKRSSSGSSFSRSPSSGSSSSRSSSASSVSSASSHSSSTSSGSADSEHLYRGVGGRGSSPSPSPKKKSIKKKKPQSSNKKPSPRVARRSSRGDGGKGPQGPGLTSKAKDMLKVTGQKPNIKLTLLGNKKASEKPSEPPASKKRAADTKVGPPAKRQAIKPAEPPQNVAPKPVKAKPDKQKSPIVPNKPIPAPVPKVAPQKPPISPTKAPAKPPMAQAALAQKEKKSTTNRREELLKQLKAVEDAIARKRSKMQ